MSLVGFLSELHLDFGLRKHLVAVNQFVRSLPILLHEVHLDSELDPEDVEHLLVVLGHLIIPPPKVLVQPVDHVMHEDVHVEQASPLLLLPCLLNDVDSNLFLEAILDPLLHIGQILGPLLLQLKHSVLFSLLNLLLLILIELLCSVLDIVSRPVGHLQLVVLYEVLWP